MLDLLVRNVNLPDGRKGVDIAIKEGKIVQLATGIDATAVTEIDGQGYLASPPFVDSHFHLDSALSLGQPRLNQSGTLLEGIALWGELKPQLTVESIKQRALAM
ncbi:MAG: cytosine deaminase, partial [Amphritea sp.]|nr:cytosine deaminase [Amphritea sp.]